MYSGQCILKLALTNCVNMKSKCLQVAWQRKHKVVDAGCALTFKDHDLGPAVNMCIVLHIAHCTTSTVFSKLSENKYKYNTNI